MPIRLRRAALNLAKSSQAYKLETKNPPDFWWAFCFVLFFYSLFLCLASCHLVAGEYLIFVFIIFKDGLHYGAISAQVFSRQNMAAVES